MSQELTKEIIYSASSLHGELLEVVDADWKDSCGIAVILQKNKKTTLQLNGIELEASFTRCSLSHVRWIDDHHILVAANENEENIFIIDLTGRLLHSFKGGEAIADIVVGKEGIWISYFDEGIYGEGISTEGLVLFDGEGNVLFRYHASLMDSPVIDDCYALCKGKGSTIWLFPYANFPLVEVNSKEETFRSFIVPEILHGARAICVREKYVYFHDPYHSNQKVYQAKIDLQEPLLLGTIQGIVRGLDPSSTHHFLSVTKQEVLLYQVIYKDG